MNARLNKKSAVRQWREIILPHVKSQYETDGVVDESARAEAWNNYTDLLQKTGQITTSQYENWSHP